MEDLRETAARKLTRAETRILALIGLGLTSKEIATIRSISVETVSNHRKRICAKLDLHSTAQLVLLGSHLNYVAKEDKPK
jgi:two-component system response regulator NreC